MLDLLLENSASEGYRPDCSLSPEEVGGGRPHPYMIFETLIRLRVYPPCATVKVGDTPADIKEGLNAGVWSVGVAATGNAIGLSQADFEALPEQERENRLTAARSQLQAAGAHYVIDSVATIDMVLDDIEERLHSHV